LSFVGGDILCHSLPFFSSCVPGPSRRPQIGRRAAAAVNPPPQILVGHSTRLVRKKKAVTQPTLGH
jgi:hypothetical protein